ncbi:MAG: formylglycine-generating enzyme family protein [Rectinemataceae bacterium]|nr:formylglycine-generating enzyme family protein [Rectinemataceae bacterium]
MLDKLFQPAVMLDWHMATSFCSAITEREKKAGRLPESYEYRLPTEAEWEYACKAGTTTAFFWGNSFGNDGAKFANTFDIKTSRIHKWRTEKGMADNDKYVASSPAGSFKPNAFGLYDMSGNVWEWCYDWYNPRAYKELDIVAPVQTKPVATELEMRGTFDRPYTIEGTSRALRGGSWGNLPSDCRSAARDSAVPETKDTGIGFRIVLAPGIKKEGYDNKNIR